MNPTILILGLVMELFIIYNYTFSMLDEMRWNKKLSVFLFFTLHGINAVKSFFLMDYILIKSLTSWVACFVIMQLLFKDKWYKKLMIHTMYLLCVIAAETIAMLMAKYVYYCNLYDFSKVTLGTYLWQITTYILIFIFSLVVAIFIRRKKINIESKPVQYIYLYISVQCLLVMLFTMFIWEYGITSNMMMATMFFVIAASTALGIAIFKILRGSERKSAEAEFLKREAELKDKHFIEIKDQYMEFRRIRHDFYNHVRVIEQLDDCGKIREYTNEIKDRFDKIEKASYCNNLTLDALISLKITEAENQGVYVQCNICDLSDVKIKDFDLCTVVSNLLDNAVTAATQTDEKIISIKISRKMGRLVISVENTSLPVTGELKTTKQDPENHGIGLNSVKTTVQKYEGDTFFGYSDGKFLSVVNMNLMHDAELKV